MTDFPAELSAVVHPSNIQVVEQVPYIQRDGEVAAIFQNEVNCLDILRLTKKTSEHLRLKTFQYLMVSDAEG
jgi:hypothetical protein